MIILEFIAVGFLILFLYISVVICLSSFLFHCILSIKQLKTKYIYRYNKPYNVLKYP